MGSTGESSSTGKDWRNSNSRSSLHGGTSSKNLKKSGDKKGAASGSDTKGGDSKSKSADQDLDDDDGWNSGCSGNQNVGVTTTRWVQPWAPKEGYSMGGFVTLLDESKLLQDKKNDKKKRRWTLGKDWR